MDVFIVFIILLLLGVPLGLAYWQYRKTGIAAMPTIQKVISYDGTFQMQVEDITGPNVASTKLEGVVALEFFLQQLKIEGFKIFELKIDELATDSSDWYERDSSYYKVEWKNQTMILILQTEFIAASRYKATFDFSSYVDPLGRLRVATMVQTKINLTKCDRECRIDILTPIKTAFEVSEMLFSPPQMAAHAAYYHELAVVPGGAFTTAKVVFEAAEIPNIDLCYASTVVRLGTRTFTPPMKRAIEAVIEEIAGGHNVGILGKMRSGKTTLTRYIVGELSRLGHTCFRLDYQSLASAGMGPAQFRTLIKQRFSNLAEGTRLVFFADESMNMVTTNSPVLPTMLDLLDGLDQKQLKCCTIISINTDQEKVDKRILQPGRVDRVVEVNPLNEAQARKLLALQSKDFGINEGRLKEILEVDSGVTLGVLFNEVLVPKPEVSKAEAILAPFEKALATPAV